MTRPDLEAIRERIDKSNPVSPHWYYYGVGVDDVRALLEYVKELEGDGPTPQAEQSAD